MSQPGEEHIPGWIYSGRGNSPWRYLEIRKSLRLLKTRNNKTNKPIYKQKVDVEAIGEGCDMTPPNGFMTKGVTHWIWKRTFIFSASWHHTDRPLTWVHVAMFLSFLSYCLKYRLRNIFFYDQKMAKILIEMDDSCPTPSRSTPISECAVLRAHILHRRLTAMRGVIF